MGKGESQRQVKQTAPSEGPCPPGGSLSPPTAARRALLHHTFEFPQTSPSAHSDEDWQKKIRVFRSLFAARPLLRHSG